jgi:protease IV
MSSSRFAPLGRLFGKVWWLVDGSRRLVLNLIFVLLVLALVLAFSRSSKLVLAEKTALVLNLSGALVEQRSSNPREAALAQVGGSKAASSTQLRDVLAALDAAQRDSKISSALLVLDDFEGAGLPALREVAGALERFKASGKPVLAWGMGFDQRQYYLAAHANEVFLHPMGVVLLQGFGGYKNYYRDALDKLGVEVSLVRAGSFKSAGEVYTLDGPSPESVEANSFLYGAMWSSYTQGIEKARKLTSGGVMALINDLPKQLAQANGNPAQLALDQKWIDGLKTRDALRQHMVDQGAAAAEGKNFRQVTLDSYVQRLAPTLSGDAVGVVVAEGAIIDGPAAAGAVGGVTTAELIRQARLDSSIKAVVLRVNSPGGSPLGSELIRRELELTREAGKPVVVSMGDVAASGGYWITMAADEVWADAATVTGSIGVFALLPHADKALDKLGVNTGGTTTTWLAAAGDPRRPVDPRFTALLQNIVDHTYRDFTTLAASARKTTAAAIDAAAQGRVWTGAQAQERGLVDSVGGLYEALQSAAKRGNLGASPRLVYMEPERTKLDRLLGMLSATAVHAVGEYIGAPTTFTALGFPPTLALQAQQELQLLVQASAQHKPFATLAHCLCGKY